MTPKPETPEDWYERIEEPVRDLVRLLRNNGFNTTCSCGHEMMVQMDLLPGMETELARLDKLMLDTGYHDFSLHWTLERRALWPHCFVELRLPNGDL